MFFSAEKVTEEMPGLASWDGQHRVAQIDHIYSATTVEPPTMADGSRQRHLTRCRDQKLLDRFHDHYDTW